MVMWVDNYERPAWGGDGVDDYERQMGDWGVGLVGGFGGVGGGHYKRPIWGRDGDSVEVGI